MRKTILVVFAVISGNALFAQNRFFTDINENAIQRTSGKKNIIIEKARTVSFNVLALKSFLWAQPSEKSIVNRNQATVLELPMPDGGTARYHIWESSVMEPGLAAKFPGIRTFAGQGIDDRTATIRFDWTELGFHAMVLSGVSGAVFIDPYQQSDKNNYTVYFKKDFKSSENFICEAAGLINQTENFTEAAGVCVGTQLRTFRLALACTGEYATAVCPPGNVTVPNTLSAMVTSVNRVTGVYEKDLSVRLTLISNTTDVIYLNASTDPFTNTSGTTMLGQNQTNMDAVIGSANYDIGHVYSTGGGGVAGLGVVCANGNKARGVTGRGNPVGDPFNIDYVAHEMGHQFGANHTFNATTGNCGGGNRSGANAVEPGSGITIMGYAGICGSANDLAPNSIDIFHGKSLDAIGNFVNSISCQATNATGNNIPVVNAGADYSIPISTPFSLTGSATDPDAGDVLTYCWEQMDIGPGGDWNTPSGNAPLFRSFLPTASPTRFFPRVSDIINNTQTIGEILPSYARNILLRLTVRDNKAGGGGVCADEMQISVIDGGGPFSITTPNGGENYASGAVQTITWNVAGTNTAPINVTDVRITLSTDGGVTYPTVLLASTANDGTESITLPCISSSTARIRIEAIGNIFYDISNSNFTIQVGFDFNTPATVTGTCPVPASLSQTLTSLAACGFANTISLTASNIPAGTTVSFNPASINPGSSTIVTLNGTNTLTAGTYTITITGSAAGAQPKTRDISFVIPASTPPSVTSQPAAQTVCTGSAATFNVSGTGATTFQWQVSTASVPAFTDIPGATATSYSTGAVTTAMNGNQYRAVLSNCASAVNSTAVTLTVVSPATITAQPAAAAEVCSSGNVSFTVAGSSSQTIIYQWQLNTGSGFNNITNTAPYSGANSPALTITGATASMNGYIYRVQLSNAVCTTPAVSGSSVLTVRQSPSVTLAAAPLQSLLPGQVTTLTATAGAPSGGTQTTSWIKNGTAITNTGNTRSINVENTGTYRVTIQEIFTSGLVCAAQSADVVIAATVSDKLFIFPSPNNGQFTVSYYNNGGNSTTRTVTVYDSKGSRVLYKSFPVAGPYTLLPVDIRTTQKGIYYVVVGDAAGKVLADGKVMVLQ